MDTKSQLRSSRVPAHFDAPTAPYLRAATVGRASQSHPVTLTAPRLEPGTYRNRHASKEVIQYHASVATVHKLRQYTVNGSDCNVTNSCPQRPAVQQCYPPKPVVLGSALPDTDMNWPRSIHETALRDMHNELVSPKAVPLERSKRHPHWPMNVPAGYEEPPVVQFQRADSSHRNLTSELNHLQMQGRPGTYSCADRFTSPNMEQMSPLDRVCGGERESAFSRPPSHVVSPAAYSSLDMEIRRLQGMITRVEMLREKYKYHEGALQYPGASPETYPQGVHGRSFSAQSNCFTPWCTEQQRQQATCANIEGRSSYSTSYPSQQDVSQLYSPRSAVNRNLHKQRASHQARCLTTPSLEFQHQRAYIPVSQKDGMPRIVDVRSLAQGQGLAVYPEKPTKSHPEIAHQKMAANPKHGMRLSTESRNETGSVESLDSGVECMSSPNDVQTQRSLASGHGRFKQTEDMYAKDGVCMGQESHQSVSHWQASFAPVPPCTSPCSSHIQPRTGPTLSPPPLTRTNRKRVLSNTLVETRTKKPKGGINFPCAATTIPELIHNMPKSASSLSGDENDRALDLSLKKRNSHESDDRQESKKHLQMQTHSNDLSAENIAENGPINLSTRCDSGVTVLGKSSPLTRSFPGISADSCPSEILHHHGRVASMEDLVALSVKLANEVPQGKEGENPTGNRSRDQQLETRGRFITKLMRRAEGMLQERPGSAFSSRGTPGPTQTRAASCETREYHNTTSYLSTPVGNIKQEQIRNNDTPEEQSSKTPDSAELDLKLRESSTKNPLYIDVMVNEALRVFRSPPSEEEMEKQDLSISSVCHSPEPQVISHTDTENDTCNIPAAASLLKEPKKSESTGSRPVVFNSTKDPPSQSLEKPQPAQKSPSAPKTPRSLPTTINFPDVRVLVRPLQPIAPKPVVRVGLPVHIQGRPLAPVENAVKVVAVKQQDHPSKANDAHDTTSESIHSAPSFLIPTEDGFRRMQKVDAKIREIYRVTIQPSEVTQPSNPNKQPQKASYSVYYREMTFPCVLRSEVPFVPTQLLMQNLFHGFNPSSVCRAMQHYNIMNRYMIRHEQEALREQLRRRGITSCKLIPLDEFHDKWDEILHFLTSKVIPEAKN